MEQAKKLLAMAADETVGYDLKQALLKRIACPQVDNEAAEF